MPPNKKINIPRRTLVPPSVVASLNSPTDAPKKSSKGMTVLIPIRGHDRSRNFKIIIPYILSQNIEPIEILVVEEDKAPTIDLDTYSRHPQIRKLFLESSLPFNKSRVMNAGTAHATFDRICMLDVDMIIQAGFLSRISSILDTRDVCFSIQQIYFLTEVPNGKHFYHDGITWAENAGFNCHGGIVAYNRNAFIRIGGMDESFIGHGSEDTEFYKRALALLKVSDLRFATVLHIPHPRDLANATKNSLHFNTVSVEAPQVRAAKLARAYQKSWGSVKQNSQLRQFDSQQKDPQTTPSLLK